MSRRRAYLPGGCVVLLIVAAIAPSAFGQSYHHYRRPDCYCPPPGSSPASPPQLDPNGKPIEPDQPPQEQPTPVAPTTSPAPTTLASAGGNMGGPTMVGDHFGNGFRFSGGGDLSLQGGIRRMKIAENVSPMPQDRVFFSFNHFDRAVRVTDTDGTGDDGPLVDLQRYTVGVEKTFFSRLASLEIRAPIIDGLNSDQSTSIGADNEGVEFGDLTITPKVVLAANRCTLLSAGMGIQVPTADDASFNNTIFVENSAVHLKPFLGLMHTPNSRAFIISYAQLDWDVSGYDVSGTTSGHFEDPLFLYLDIQYGYWLYQNCNCCCGGVTGIAPIVELHYATNLEDFVGVPGAIIPDRDHVDILNLTAGLKFRLGCNSLLTVAAAAPLRNEDNRQFDWEMITQLQYGF